MNSERIYLDNAASTPIFPEVIDVVSKISKENFGNPSSSHYFGVKANKLIEESKNTFATFLNSKPNEIFFTSSGTESNNLALLGTARANKKRGNHIITTKIEHPSILNACKSLEKEGFEVTYLNVGKNGLINFDELKKSIKPETVLVSIHLANSEIGEVQPIEEVSELLNGKKVIFHVDACQATAYMKIDVKKLGVDLLTINSSKAYGPKGVAVLYVKEGIDIFPIHFGGGQQDGLRSGTENVSGIVGFAKAVEIISSKRDEKAGQVKRLRDDLQQKIEEKGGKINVNNSPRLPNHLSVIMPIDEKDLVKYFDKMGVAVSSGSACSSRSLTDSYVLQNIGLSSEEINKTIRISLGYETTKEEAKKFLDKI